MSEADSKLFYLAKQPGLQIFFFIPFQFVHDIDEPGVHIGVKRVQADGAFIMAQGGFQIPLQKPWPVVSLP